MDPKLRHRVSAWLKQYESLPREERSAFLEQCHRRDAVTATLMQELLDHAQKNEDGHSD